MTSLSYHVIHPFQHFTTFSTFDNFSYILLRLFIPTNLLFIATFDCLHDMFLYSYPQSQDFRNHFRWTFIFHIPSESFPHTRLLDILLNLAWSQFRVSRRIITQRKETQMINTSNPCFSSTVPKTISSYQSLFIFKSSNYIPNFYLKFI